MAPRSVLDPAGSSARTIEDLWWLMLAAGGAVFVIVAVALYVGLRRDPASPDDRGGAPEATDRLDGATRGWIVGGGVVLPVVAITVVLVATVVAMRTIEADHDEVDLTVEVTGHQWWWEVRYPDHDVVTANEVHVPAGASVRLVLRSADVIHSFWVPALAGKMDLLPERANELVIDADEPGRYPGRCAEFCGVQHTNMDIDVVAHDEAGFAAWLDEQRAPAVAPTDDLTRRGLTVVESPVCANCHTVSGTAADGTAGPDLSHVMSRAEIGAGTASTDQLRAWITDPHAIKDGVLMPAPDLSPDELDAVVAYVESLE